MSPVTAFVLLDSLGGLPSGPTHGSPVTRGTVHHTAGRPVQGLVGTCYATACGRAMSGQALLLPKAADCLSPAFTTAAMAVCLLTGTWVCPTRAFVNNPARNTGVRTFPWDSELSYLGFCIPKVGSLVFRVLY